MEAPHPIQEFIARGLAAQKAVDKLIPPPPPSTPLAKALRRIIRRKGATDSNGALTPASWRLIKKAMKRHNL
jgi:hypothetical protein